MTTHAHAPRPLPLPGAAGIGAALTALTRRVWDVLAAAGASRARHELRRLAATYDVTQPELAAKLRSAALEMTERA